MVGQRVRFLAACAGLATAWAVGCNAQLAKLSDDESLPSATSGTGPGAGGGGGKSPVDPSLIALPCDGDDDCGGEPGLRCITVDADDTVLPSVFGSTTPSGVAGGYCTKDCTLDDECPFGSICVQNDTAGICVRTCEFGSPMLQALDEPLAADKCHGRDDLMCAPLTNGFDACLPVCGSDDQCGSRHCNLRMGLCTDEPRQGLPLGAGSCTPDDMETTDLNEDSCTGFCQPFSGDGLQPDLHSCSAWCSYGGELASTQNCGGPANGLCVFPADVNGLQSGTGDLAFCAGSCTSHDGCSWATGMFCFDLGVLETYHVGYCLVAESCPYGECTAADQVCTQTNYGPVCLEVRGGTNELLIPLGEAGQGGSGGGV
jgi:hypothetical protein